MAGETYANVPAVHIDGTALKHDIAALLTEVLVDDATHHPAVFSLRFRDPHRRVLSASGMAIGSTASVYVLAGDRRNRELLVQGDVTALEAEIDHDGGFTVVRGMDRGHRLLRGRRVVTYRQMTASEVAVKIARRAGLQPGVIDRTAVVHELLTQANSSDWDFLTELGRASGRNLSVTEGRLNFRSAVPAGSSPRPTVRSRQSPLVLERGANLVACRAVVTAARQVDDVQVRSWDPRTKKAVAAYAKAATTTERDLGLTPGDVARPFGSASLLASVTACRSQSEADDLARSLASDIAAGFAEVEAEAFGNPMLRAGTAIALTGVGAPFQGRYTVTHSRHVFNSELGYRTWILVNSQADRAAGAMLTGAGRPARGGHTTGAVGSGLSTGVVADAKDPMNQGRVRLRFPWLSDDHVSDWARCAQQGGSDGGGLVGAEVGDEVLVGFEHGRLDMPYVIGGLYNGVDQPTKLDGPPVDTSTGRVVRRSWSSRKGNRVELLDVPGGPRGVKLSSSDGRLTVELDESGTRVVVTSGGDVEITSAKNVTIKGKDVTVQSGGDLALTGKSVALKGQQIALEGTAVEVKGGKVDVNGGTQCSIKAALIQLN